MRWAWLVSLVVPAALLALVAITACGPSYQAVYEADVTFEHCYAMDDRADAPLPVKRDCWQIWRTRYAVGQSRDKLEYAAARAEALSRGTALPTDDSMAAAAPGEAHVSQVVAPQLTNAFAPPPKTLDQQDGGVDPNDMVNATAPQITWSAASSLGGGGAWSQDAGAASPTSLPSGPNPTPTTSTTTKGAKTGKTRALASNGATALPAAPGAACSGGCTKTYGECRDTCHGSACNACDTGYRSCMRSCFK